MHTELSQNEVDLLVDAVWSHLDSAVDTKRDLDGDELREQEEYVESLNGLLTKLNALRDAI